MKKLFNKRFALILGSTITLLIVLTVAIVFLTKENTKSFVRGGYIIASSKENSTKYYFDEGTTYKTNVNKELVFTDTSGEKVNVETDNFLHYIDGGIKFLKNGVIMELDSVNATIVPYYNITNKSLLEYSKKSYYIETRDKTLAFNNIVGRISDNKYLVAGVDIKLQLAGNENVISGDYFEITFIEDGVIKVENQEVSYQTTAEDSYILSGNTKIDLGLKKVYYNDEEKMSLTQMTIDGNENIEIIPNEEGEGSGGSGDGTGDGTENGGGSGSGSGDGDGTGSGTGSGDGTGSGSGTGEGDGNGDGDGTGDGTGSGSGSGDGNGEGDGTGDGTGTGTGSGSGDGTGSGSGSGGGYVERRANIEIVEAEVGVNNINAKFYINDPESSIKGDLVVHITNTDTGKRVYSILVDKTQTEFNIGVATLSPDANYVLSVNEETDGEYDTQYFQKLFKTDSLGISLEKKYVTSDSLAYEVKFEENTQVKSVRINISDEEYNEVLPSIIVTPEDNLALFEGLKNNKTYNIVLDNVILDNLEYNEVYTIYKTVKTLKKTPSLSGLTSETDETTSTFTIGVDEIVDEDNSITKYSYYIYNADEMNFENRDSIEPVQVITKNDASKIKINIDNQTIFAKTNYKFKIVAEYYDNEKYGEYETELSSNFILAGRPYISFEMDTEKSTFNKIAGKVTINDENCTVPLKGRNCSSEQNYNNDFKIVYYEVNNKTQQTLIENVSFDPQTLQYYLEVDSLTANTEYIFEVYGDVDLLDGKGIRKGMEIGTFRAITNGVDILTVDTWIKNETGVEDLINLTSKIISTNNNHNLANSLNHLTFNLYAGDVKDAINTGEKVTPIASKTVSGTLKDNYYNSFFTINTKGTFDFVDTEITTEEGTTIARAIDILKDKTSGQLPAYYTIEITDAWDEGYQNEILIENNIYVFQTPPTIRIEENEILPTINAEPIINENLIFDEEDNKIDSTCIRPDVGEEKLYEKTYDRDLGCTTIVGYKVDVGVNLNVLKKYFSDINELIYYVCDADVDANCAIDKAIETRKIDLKKTDITETIFYLENGTKYSVKDEKLARGHNYIFKAKFNVKYGKQTEGNNILEVEALYPTKNLQTEIKETPKQAATYSIYIDKTTANEVHYKYSFTDVDQTLFDNKFYYTVDGGEEQTFEFSDKDFVINNLTNDSVYSLSFKRALIKNTKSIEQSEVGKYIFDGEYVYSEDTINFERITYENDNRLRVLILENELNKKLVDRVSAYQITLSTDDENIKDYVRVYPTDNLKTCTKDEIEYKCIIVDYADIKEFKTKDTNIKITAYYDSGIINNDFVNISKSETGYILQNNSVYNPDKIKGNYIYINKTKGISTTPLPHGMYEYNGNTKTTLQIVRKIDLNKFIFKNENINTPKLIYANDSIYIQDSAGNNQSINNKLLSKVDLGTNNSTFKFNSYIPKISVNTKNLVNGTRLTITPYGLDETILKEEFQNEDGKYYYYLKIYNEKITETEEGPQTSLELYKEEKIEINPTESKITLTKYMPNTKYHFEVYAYLLKDNEYKETLLFDAQNEKDYISSMYNFSTLSKEEIVSLTPNYAEYSSKSETNEDGTYKKDGIYSMRELTLQINTKEDIGEYDVKFELYDIEDNLVYESTTKPISSEYLSYDYTKVTKDITNDDMVFGDGYYTLKIYTLTDVYDSDEKQSLEIYNSKINLKKLAEPTITVTKAEDVNSLNFKIKITDNDKVIKDGKYCVELLDKSGDNLTIQDQETKICGLYVNEYDDNGITFNNLNSDTIYIFRVYTDVYINNVGVTEKEREVEARSVLSTSTEYGVALGSVAANGTSTNITLSFSSGVNVGNIRKINYTLMQEGGKEIISSEYTMGEDKNFIVSTKDNIETYTLLINPEGITIPSDSYIVLSYWVDNPNGEGLVLLNNKKYEVSIKF